MLVRSQFRVTKEQEEFITTEHIKYKLIDSLVRELHSNGLLKVREEFEDDFSSHTISTIVFSDVQMEQLQAVMKRVKNTLPKYLYEELKHCIIEK